MAASMTTRERFHALMNFEPADRLPLLEWCSWWGVTLDRWHSDGMPAELTDVQDIRRHFGLDIYLQHWFPNGKDSFPGLPEGEPGWIKSMDDYLELVPHMYREDAFDRDRLRVWAEHQKQGDVVVWLTLEGFFWFTRSPYMRILTQVLEAR